MMLSVHSSDKSGLEKYGVDLGGDGLFQNLLFIFGISKTFSSFPNALLSSNIVQRILVLVLSFIEMKILYLFEELGEKMLYQYSYRKEFYTRVNTNNDVRFCDFTILWFYTIQFRYLSY